MIDAIRRAEPGLTFVPVRNEEAGAFAAGAEAMVAGRPAAVIGSSGPGSLHLLNGLYDCDRNGAPVFAIVTHIPSPEIGTEYFQETRPDLIFADCTRYIGYITSAAQMPRLAELALEAAILERGVGMVILPGDVGVMEIDGSNRGRRLAKSRPKIRPVDSDLETLTEHIAASSRPMIFGGEGCRDAREEVLQLARLLHAPVGYSYRAKDILEADNPNAVGMTGCWDGAGRIARSASATCFSCWERTFLIASSCRPTPRSCRSTTTPVTSAVAPTSTSGWSETSATRCAV